jgi:hypothetical protein
VQGSSFPGISGRGVVGHGAGGECGVADPLCVQKVEFTHRAFKGGGGRRDEGEC